MRRSAGAIFRERRPATIIRSDCRGLPRNTSAPNRAISYRLQLIAIISIAQHARPNVTGQMDERRAHCTIFSTLVVSTGISDSSPTLLFSLCLCFSLRVQLLTFEFQLLTFLFLAPIERALPPDVHVTGEQQHHEQQHLDEPVPPETAQRHRPW